MAKDILITPKPAGNPSIAFKAESAESVALAVLTDGSVQFTGNATSFKFNETDDRIDIGGPIQMSGNLYFNDTNTTIFEDGSGNMSFTDAITGTKTLAELAENTDTTYSAGNNISLSGSPATTINVEVTGTEGNLVKIGASGELEDTGIEAVELDFDLIDFITLEDVTEDTTTVVPAKYRITSIVIEETAGVAAGDISIGTASSGTQVVNAETVGSGSLVDCPIGQSIFSATSSQIIYISSSNWGASPSSSIDVHIRLEKFTE